MKIKAITEEEPRQKDFWDIYELSNRFSLQDMIEWAIQRDQWSVTERGIEKDSKTFFMSKSQMKA